MVQLPAMIAVSPAPTTSRLTPPPRFERNWPVEGAIGVWPGGRPPAICVSSAELSSVPVAFVGVAVGTVGVAAAAVGVAGVAVGVTGVGDGVAVVPEQFGHGGVVVTRVSFLKVTTAGEPMPGVTPVTTADPTGV